MITEKDFDKPFIKQKIEETKKIIENEIINQFECKICPLNLNLKDEDNGILITYILKKSNILLKGFLTNDFYLNGLFRVSEEDLRIEAETQK